MIGTAGISKYSPTLRGSVHGVLEYKANAAGTIIYPTKPSFGLRGCVIFCRHLLISWEKCRDLLNVGHPAMGYMVKRITVIASVVYLAIVVGGLV